MHNRGPIALAASVAALLLPAAANAQIFYFTGGEQSYAVPVGAAAIHVSAVGAPGGSGDLGAAGGKGAAVYATLPASAGQQVFVEIGASGANGSGVTGGTIPNDFYAGGGGAGGSVGGGNAPDGGGGAGGGATILTLCSRTKLICKTSDTLLVAAGGGGGGGGTGAGAGGAGAAAGQPATGSTKGGGAGTATAGGTAGAVSNGGSYYQGGPGADGSSQTSSWYDGGGGGGGGGLYGGGGGGVWGGVTIGVNGGGGGGGGSNFVIGSASAITIATDPFGIPVVVITPVPAAPSCGGNAVNTLPGGSTVTIVLPCSTPMGIPITETIASGPTHGTLGAVNQTTGTVAYTPAPGFSGTDSFTYDAANSGGTATPATVTITVPAASQTGGTSGGGTSGGTSGGGTSSGGTRQRCVVPALKGKTLTQARRLLTRAGCALGKVKRPKTRTGHKAPKNLVVVGQSVKAGRKLAHGAKIALTLGAARKR